MSWIYCLKCGKRRSEKDIVLHKVCRATYSSPAEYEDWCDQCAKPDDRDDAYERAAARYDGEGKDWR